MAKRLGRNRKVYKWQKEHIFGENAAINGVHGPAYMLRNQRQYTSKDKSPGSVPSAPPPKAGKQSRL